MPVERCEEGGRPGYRCGSPGACYAYDAGDEAGRAEAKRRAVAQCVAIGEEPGLGAASLTRVLRRAEARALELEERLVSILGPILDGAGDEAARRFRALATDHLTASARRDADRRALAALGRSVALGLASSLALRAAAPSPEATMVALYPRADEAAAIADAGGLPASELHVTLAYLGEVEEGALRAASDLLREVAAAYAPLAGRVAGVGAFGGEDGGAPAILLPDVPGLVELRQAVCEALVRAGTDYSRDHGFTPHVTVAYGDGAAPDAGAVGAPLHFDALVLARGDARVAEVPLVGSPALTAAAPWGAPAPDELVDVEALVSRLRTKTDPVRLAVAGTVMGAALEGVGLSFDATNPFAAKVLAGSAAQVTHVAETTRLNVMRIVAASYDQGLSIDDAAVAIRAGMREATPARARMIAITELAGVVNGSSLAAARIYSGASGDALLKRWLTAPGAKHPRHTTYAGLDGQTVRLDESFSVGGHDLDHPGDPDGPPGEVIRCRCTLEYVEPEAASAAPTLGPAEAPVEKGVETETAIEAVGRAVEVAVGRRFRAATAEERAALKVPPAWRDVRVATDPEAALQVVGVDAKGRAQYRYSAAHVEAASRAKFERLRAFEREAPKLAERVALDARGGSEEAAVLELIRRTGFRVGSDAETGAAVKAYGATTLRAEHVRVDGARVSFDFVAKKGVRVEKTVEDADLAALLAPRVAAGGRLFATSDARVRAYLSSIDGPFKVKDFRTARGTAVAREAVARTPAPGTAAEAAAARREVGRIVAADLGNTPAVALESYVDPRVFAPWEAAADAEAFGRRALDALDREGGFSLAIDGSAPVTERYVVALGKADEVVLEPATVSAEAISEYAAAKGTAVRGERAFLGGWRDTDTGRVYLDLSTSFADLGEALAHAAANDQLAIWDAVERVEVRVAGRRGLAAGAGGGGGWRDLPIDKQVERMRVMYARVRPRAAGLADLFETTSFDEPTAPAEAVALTQASVEADDEADE